MSVKELALEPYRPSRSFSYTDPPMALWLGGNGGERGEREAGGFRRQFRPRQGWGEQVQIRSRFPSCVPTVPFSNAYLDFTSPVPAHVQSFAFFFFSFPLPPSSSRGADAAVSHALI